MTRLTIPKFKSLINKGMSPALVLEKVFKQYKGTIHDTVYWKKQIKKHINNYMRYKKTGKSKSRSRTRKFKSRRKDGVNKNDDI
jgi:hypothetical protein